VDASRRVYAACLERRDAIVHEKSTLDSTLKSLRPPSQPAFVTFILLMWAAAAGLYNVSQAYVAATLLTVSLLPLLWYRSRVRSTEAVEKKMRDCTSRLITCTNEVKQTEDEARQIEREIWKMTGKLEITAGEIEERVTELDQLLKVNGDLRKLDEV